MKRICCLILSLCFAQLAWSAELEAWFDYKVFIDPNDGPYVETHLNFTAQTVSYAAISGEIIQAKVRATVIIKQDDRIADFRKIDIDGPEVTASTMVDFMDVQRFSLPAGKYSFEIELEDLNNSQGTIQHFNQDFEIKDPGTSLHISDITFVKAFAKAETQTDLTRSGYDILPYVNNYFPSSFDALIVYAEIYNTDHLFGEGEKFALTTSIKTKDGTVAGDQQKIKREKSARVIPILQTFDISSLRTDEYFVVIEVRDRDNTLLRTQAIEFFRNKYVEDPSAAELARIDVTRTFAADYMDREVLMEHVNSLHPIASNLERSTIEHQLPSADLILLQQYMYHFWARRDSENPQAAWEAYLLEVQKVEEAFGARLKRGWQTDRGRVYLQYGPPNTRVMRHNANDVWPYEIWHFYDLGTQHDRRFLFYDHTLVNEDFTLLHSDVQGEVQNHEWKLIMRGRMGQASPQFVQDETLNQHDNISFDFQELETLFYSPR